MKRHEQAAGAPFRKTHDIGSLIQLLAEIGEPLPAEFDSLDDPTPFGTVYRYEDFDAAVSFDRQDARGVVRALRIWCEQRTHALNP